MNQVNLLDVETAGGQRIGLPGVPLERALATLFMQQAVHSMTPHD
jgi:hypothetical protein